MRNSQATAVIHYNDDDDSVILEIEPTDKHVFIRIPKEAANKILVSTSNPYGIKGMGIAEESMETWKTGEEMIDWIQMKERR